MNISGGTNDSAVVHAVEPMFRSLGASIMTFHGSENGHATSIAHDLMHLWLTRTLNPDSRDLTAAYTRLSPIFGSLPLWDAEMQVSAAKLVLDFLQRDATRIPVGMVIRYLKAALDLAPSDSRALRLILEAALSVLHAEPAGSEHHKAVTQIAADAVSVMRNLGFPETLQAWLVLHLYDSAYAHLFGGNPETFAAEIAGSQALQEHPDLAKQALGIMAAKYPGAPLEKS
jgi:hypothetical protein